MEEVLKKIKMLPKNKIITILPHDCIDVDSIFSAILLSKLLSHFNIKSEIVIFDKKVDKDTNYFLNKLNYNVSKYVTKFEDESRLLFLVDHYETIHSGTVIGCIDHHFTTKEICYNIYLYKNSSSASYIIYNLLKKAKIKITEEIVLLVSYATLVDTCSFTSTKTNVKEKEEILQLLKSSNFNVEKMVEESLCLQDLSKMTFEEIIYNGVKSYNFNTHKVRSSYVQTNNLGISCEIIDKISNIVKKENLDMWVFIIFDMINKKTKVYKIMQEKIQSEEICMILSRGQDIMPKIEEKYK